ncbi:hypothetical protein [Micromonospora sp. NPDC005171]|uniref:hypothetical protein n=1 Tax=Micromonospora sp. NPDC005171 TaxID=3156866 RepID=UPI0033AEAEA0
MSGLADSLVSHRRFAEALTLTTGAREDLTFMSRWEPLRFRPTLGNLLFVIARCHLGLREQDAAVAAVEEAVGHYRWLAERDPVRYQPRLVVALRTLAGTLKALGLYEKAAWATDEAEAMESR